MSSTVLFVRQVRSSEAYVLAIVIRESQSNNSYDSLGQDGNWIRNIGLEHG